jgi:hypothetical protein
MEGVWILPPPCEGFCDLVVEWSEACQALEMRCRVCYQRAGLFYDNGWHWVDTATDYEV